uniref:Uncharacterized protein n=1 Tax=Arundo donax TaxID=35708 RepID=A0A0A8ZBB5_ARUDO
MFHWMCSNFQELYAKCFRDLETTAVQFLSF